MNWILPIPLPLRLVFLAVIGAAIGSVLNLATYRLAWNQRLHSPWSTPPLGASRRRWPDRVPLIGWWSMRRESPLLGRGFWIRPLVVEMATGLLFAGLYFWEVPCMGLYAGPLGNVADLDFQRVLHEQFFSHLVLLSLMIVASLIDLDEKTIPDAVTVPGTIAGLSLAVVFPWSLLPAATQIVGGAPVIEFLTLASPNPWPNALGGLPNVAPLVLALSCWSLWCGGLMPRRWNTRHGWATAVRVFVHRLRKEQATYLILAMWLVGAVGIAMAAWQAPRANWAALLTALVGVAVGGGLIWLVRVIGTAALAREAMGFGDVTLMAMIGAFLGWQTSLLVFFFAPFFGLVVAVVQWVSRGEHEIPYGPFLCLATLAVMLRWATIWEGSRDLFAIGWLLPALMGGSLVLMGGMLLLYRLALGLWSGGGRR